MRQNGEGPPAPDEIRRRAISLYTFLKEFAELRAETIRSVERYDQVLWLEDIPREPECYCAAWHERRDDESEAWVEVRKPRLKAPPVPPPPLRPWLTESEWQTSESELPSLREQIILASPADDEAPQQLELSQSPDIRALWERYVETEWWPWREEDRRGRDVQAHSGRMGTRHTTPESRKVATQVRHRIERGGERLWRYDDFPGVPPSALAQALSRLTRQGKLRRVSKGVYYRGRETAFGRSVTNMRRTAPACTEARIEGCPAAPWP